MFEYRTFYMVFIRLLSWKCAWFSGNSNEKILPKCTTDFSLGIHAKTFLFLPHLMYSLFDFQSIHNRFLQTRLLVSPFQSTRCIYRCLWDGLSRGRSRLQVCKCMEVRTSTHRQRRMCGARCRAKMRWNDDRCFTRWRRPLYTTVSA